MLHAYTNNCLNVYVVYIQITLDITLLWTIGKCNLEFFVWGENGKCMSTALFYQKWFNYLSPFGRLQCGYQPRGTACLITILPVTGRLPQSNLCSDAIKRSKPIATTTLLPIWKTRVKDYIRLAVEKRQDKTKEEFIETIKDSDGVRRENRYLSSKVEM